MWQWRWIVCVPFETLATYPRCILCLDKGTSRWIINEKPLLGLQMAWSQTSILALGSNKSLILWRQILNEISFKLSYAGMAWVGTSGRDSQTQQSCSCCRKLAFLPITLAGFSSIGTPHLHHTHTQPWTSKCLITDSVCMDSVCGWVLTAGEIKVKWDKRERERKYLEQPSRLVPCS